MTYNFEWIKKNTYQGLDFQHSVHVSMTTISLRKLFVKRMKLNKFTHIRIGIDKANGIVALLPVNSNEGYSIHLKENRWTTSLGADAIAAKVRTIIGESPIVSLESLEGNDMAVLSRDPQKSDAPAKAEEPMVDADPAPRRGRPPKESSAEEPIEHEAYKGCRKCYKGKPCSAASFRMLDGKEVCSNMWEKKA